MSIADTIKRHTPWPIRALSRRVKRSLRQALDARLSCKEVFTRIYANNEWGGAAGELYSGPGSSEEAAVPYIGAIGDFIRRLNIHSVVDLGCGDFRIGRHLAAIGMRYTGVDIVDAVIARNQATYGSGTVAFVALNIIDDELPDGELCLIREVFQHLSNDQIRRVLPKLEKYKYIIITDHQPPPAAGFIPNLDKPHGGSIRLHDHSALALDKPPFSVKNVELMLDLPAPAPLYDQDERMRSFLIRMPERP